MRGRTRASPTAVCRMGWQVTILGSLLMLVTCAPGCGQSHQKTLDFAGLLTADRIEVRTTSDRAVATVAEQGKIRAAAEFIEKHRDGWVDVWTGPRAPWLILDFYRDRRYIGGFGIATSYLVAGSLSQDAPSGRDYGVCETSRPGVAATGVGTADIRSMWVTVLVTTDNGRFVIDDVVHDAERIGRSRWRLSTGFKGCAGTRWVGAPSE